MSSLNKTPHYNLSQFGDSPDDKPSWRGDYTADMSRIDAQMYRNSTDITTATAAANNANTAAGQAKTAADGALGLAQANKADISELDGYFGELGVTSAVTAQNLLTTINGKADSSALAGKVDAGSVYTKGESDGRYLQLGGYSGTAASINSTAITAKDDASVAKSTAAAAQTSVNAVAAVTTDLTELVWIGDSLSTGYQPRGAVLAESKRIPQRVASKLGLNLHVFANNASGYGKAGDGGKTFLTLASEVLSAMDVDARKKVKYVVICGGRNDTGDTYGSAIGVFDALLGTGPRAGRNFPNASAHAIFLWDNAGIPSANAQAMNGIASAAAANGLAWHPWTWTLGMGHPDWFANENDPHFNADGANYIAGMLASTIAGDCEPCMGELSGEVGMTGGCSGKLHWRFTGGVVTLTAKFSASEPSGTIAKLPKFIDLGDNFIMILGGAGNQLAFAHLDDGDLNITGIVGGGTLSGNCWITPQSFSPIGQE
ncbi:MAG: Protein of unknown function (DUF459) [Bacteriophage sp.]|nr:MAG: Protein of unknown function (DUF459) [Bacteriophage sp.]